MPQPETPSGALHCAVLRNPSKADAWAARGCQIALAGMEQKDELAAAFEGVAGVFILPPSEFDPAPGYPEHHRHGLSAARYADSLPRSGAVDQLA